MLLVIAYNELTKCIGCNRRKVTTQSCGSFGSSPQASFPFTSPLIKTKAVKVYVSFFVSFPSLCYNQILDGLHSVGCLKQAPFVMIAVECNKFNQVFTDLKCMKCAKVLETFLGQNMYRTGCLKHIKADKLIWSCILFTAADNFPYLCAIKSPPQNNESWRANSTTLSACTPKSVISLFLSSARWNKKDILLLLLLKSSHKIYFVNLC